MSFDRQKGQELVEQAELGTWSLECDEKLLEIMKDVANKIETHSANIKSNISKLDLMIDGTKVKLSNLARINSIKNTNYCENLIQDDKDLSPDEEPKLKEPVKLSPQIAIENGLKLMESCFEKHRVNLDPSSSQSQTSIVYRPIDKYMNVLPHLIGSNEWKQKWHVGLLEKEVNSRQNFVKQPEQVDNDIEGSDSLQQSRKSSMIAGSSLMASQDSLAKSTSSFGDQMTINRPDDLFDEDDNAPYDSQNLPPSTAPLFFRPQTDQRKIVNLFDDEPPSLNPSPSSARKPVNLFDDYGSVDSLPFEESEKVIVKHQQPPVDLFNDNDFDDFIKKIEAEPQPEASAVKENVSSAKEREPEHDIRKKLSEEIMKVQLKKVSVKEVIPKSTIPDKKVVESAAVTTRVQVETKKREKPKEPESVQITPQIKKTEQEKVPEKPNLKKVTNLFDDDDDDDDYFTEIMRQKNMNKPKEAQPSKDKPKRTNLFDDEDDNDAFDDIFKSKLSLPVKDDSGKILKKSSLLFDDDENDVPSYTQSSSKNLENTAKITSKLFADDDELDILATKPDAPKTSIKPMSNEQVKEINTADIEKPPAVFQPTSADQTLKAMEEANVISNYSSSAKQDEPPNIGNFNYPSDLSKNKETAEISNPEPVVVVEDSEIKKDMNADKSEPIQPLTVNIEVSESREPASDLKKEEKIENVSRPTEDNASLSNNQVTEKASNIFETPSESVQISVPFLNDEPPDDESESWETEDNFDEPEPIVKTNPTNYPVIPVFDDLPPEDDFVPTKPELPEFNWESEEEVESVNKPEIEKKPKSVLPTEISVAQEPPIVNQTSVDEIDRSIPTGSIKSKLDMFIKKAEEPKAVTSSINVKPLPGKLNSNLKINVGALMPGARLSREVSETITQSPSDSPPSSSTVSVSKSIVDSDNKSGLLNNELAKSRARIPVKRRPSTRRGRQENYSKTVSLHGLEDEAEVKPKFPELSASTSSLNPPIKNLSMSMFDDGDDDEDFLTTLVEKKKPLAESANKLPAEPFPKTVTTNKISVFYDDEDDTRIMVEKQKLEEENKKKLTREAAPSSKLFEDEPSIKEIVTKVNVDKVQPSVFYESDDELFGEKKAELIKPQVKQVLAKPKQSNSLFDDDDEEDDLFASLSKKSAKPAPVKSSKLFESDDESEPKVSTTAVSMKPSKSLFGDGESDDDDLFSSKPRSTSLKASTSSSKTSTIIKKQSTKAINDPLKDLLND